MSPRLKLWWRGRSVREQRLLLVLAALLAVTMMWLIVIRPLGDLLSAARGDAARAAIATGKARAAADTIRLLRRTQAAVPHAPVARTLGEAASAAGFPADRIAPAADGSATITIESARAPALFGWIEGLEARRGLIVDRLSARPTGERTLAATITVRERGR